MFGIDLKFKVCSLSKPFFLPILISSLLMIVVATADLSHAIDHVIAPHSVCCILKTIIFPSMPSSIILSLPFLTDDLYFMEKTDACSALEYL
jgi:hypothetical protein